MKNFDWILLSAVGLLVIVSLLELYGISFSSETQYVSRQLSFVVVGFLAMLFFASMDYRILMKNVSIYYFSAIIALILVLAIGVNVRGTVGWIAIGSFTIQIVEFVKVALIIFLAGFIAKKQTVFGTSGRLIVSFLLTLVLVILILMQPDFGSAMVLLTIWLGMLFVSGIKKWHFVAIISVVGVALVGGWFLLADYQRDRVMTFIDPSIDPLGSGYNVIQSLIAVGSGGITGSGLGRGTQTHLHFLPEKHTDFIYAVIAEEFGIFGALFVLIAFSVILYRLWRIALNTQGNFGYLIVSGVMILLFTHITITIGMNIGIMPVTGLPLPLVSYGGSSFLATSVALGIVLSIHRVNQQLSRSV